MTEENVKNTVINLLPTIQISSKNNDVKDEDLPKYRIVNQLEHQLKVE